MKKILSIIVGFLIISTLVFGTTIEAKAELVDADFGVKYTSHIQNKDWESKWASNGEMSGTEGQSLRLEALKIQLENAPSGVGIRYSAHVQNVDWMSPVQDGAISGTTGKELRLEAIKIELTNAPKGYHVAYQVHVQDIGWQEWVYDGEIAGTVGKSLRVEAIRIKILKDTEIEAPSDNGLDVSVSTHVSDVGWTDYVNGGAESGRPSSGKRVEAFILNPINLPQGIELKYQAHVQNVGWMNSVKSGEVSGTEGRSLRMEAFKIWLEGNNQNLNVLYRAYVEGIGWTNWLKNGEIAGTVGMGKRIEGIQVKISRDITDIKPKVITGVSGFNSITSGNFEEFSECNANGVSLEGVKFAFKDNESNLGITYQVHTQDRGWLPWVSNGEFAGIQGKNLRMEALRVKLTGNTKNYHVYYQTNVDGYGWQGWVRDGEISGTVGLSRAIKGIRIAVLPTNNPDLLKNMKVAIDLGHNVGNDKGATGIRFEDDLIREVGNKVISKLKDRGVTVIETLPKSASSVRDSLQKRVTIANDNEVNRFYSLHFNAFSSSSAKGSEVYYTRSDSRSLAQNIQNELVSLGYYNRGVKQSDFFVTKNTNMPSVLIESCFLTSPEDMQRYNAENIANAIVNGILK